MKLIESSLAVWGKLNDAGTMTSGRSARPLEAGVWRASRVLHDSFSTGRTMNRSPATVAVISASRSARRSRGPDRRQRGDEPGSTHRPTSSATAT
jgi:hypothetical protein